MPTSRGAINNPPVTATMSFIGVMDLSIPSVYEMRTRAPRLPSQPFRSRELWRP
jgi:hypothetical protein